MNEETNKLYERMLRDLPYEKADPAIDVLIATTMRLPTISRVRRAILEPEVGIPTADEGWVAIQTHEPELHDLVAHVAHLLGGTFNIRTSEDPELTRVRFVKVYEQLYRKAVDDALAEGVRAQHLRLPKAS